MATEDKITVAEFMVDGYHYTEPTLSGSTDSCRIYVDTDKAGEDSNVENEVWEVPSTAYLHYIAQDSISLIDVTGDAGGESGPLNFSSLQDDDIVSFINLPTGTVTNTPISIKKVKEQYTDTSGQGDPFFTNNSLKAYVYWSDGLMSVRRRSSSEAEMINISVARNVNRPRLLHLKGIHGFYVQT